MEQEANRYCLCNRTDRPMHSRAPSTSSEGNDGAREWPTTGDAVDKAREFLKECASARQSTLLLPDKDADGLCSGLILYHTLIALGLPESLIQVHFVAKGSNVHTSAERTRIAALEPSPRYVLIADQGSRPGPPPLENARTLVVDHHLSGEFPDGATVLSACRHPPIATSSALVYVLCRPLLSHIMRDELTERLDWLCVLGTMGDLGANHRWEDPWPDMAACTRQWTKKVLGEAVSLVNAPRRTAFYDISTAWKALLSSNPSRITSSGSSDTYIRRLHDARFEIRAETERCGHTAPTYSSDGRVALVRIESEAQVHPLIATRWASTLKSVRLQIVICANSGYLPGAGTTNFACRVARCALPKTKNQTKSQGKGSVTSERRAHLARFSVQANADKTSAEHGEGEINIPDILRAYAARVPGLADAMGEDFARGHAQASGGIVRTDEFERLWEVIRDANELGAEGSPKKRRKVGSAFGETKGGAGQKNTLDRWISNERGGGCSDGL